MKFDWSFPYASLRMPVFAENMVVTSQPLAAEAGLFMLRQGGCAVDAAIAAAITLTVVEPTSNGIGGDAFALVWDGQDLHGYNGSGRSPAGIDPERFYHLPAMPQLGWDPVTVPGAVNTWGQLWERFGCLPFEELFKPAIHYAENGFIVSPKTASMWEFSKKKLHGFKSFEKTFLINGRSPLPGERFRCPEMASTLEAIAKSRGEDFYTGKIARKIAEQAEREGGALSFSDLAEHVGQWVEPVFKDYRSARIYEIPPNGQGVVALIALGILDHFNISDYSPDSTEAIHLQIEALKIAFSVAFRHVSDPDFMEIGTEGLLSDAFLAAQAQRISMDAALKPERVPVKDSGTVYLAAADARGMMVSYIQSNYMGFGSGIVIEGTGIAMQNRGFGFSTDKTQPNRIDRKKRPFHTIIPAFVMHGGKPCMSLGVMGAHMQPQGHVQMMTRIFDHHQNPQAALDAPRWHLDESFRIAVEPSFPEDVLKGLLDLGHQPADTAQTAPWLFGGGQIIMKTLSGGYAGASDPRKDGQAVGF